MTSLMMIEGVKVRQDAEGRYCLNDLHKAAGAIPHQQPAKFFANQHAQDLISELGEFAVTSKAGRNGGTFVVKELVYSYAMWISPSFHLRVIRTFDALVSGELVMARGVAMREKARLESGYLNDAVKTCRIDSGKPVKHYHFSNEYDLVNRIVLGCSSKQYRERHGLPRNASIRDHLTPAEVECIAHLQHVDTGLLWAGMSFEQRKHRLSQIYMRRHAARLCSEVQRLEA